jgi:hypothetical protein
LELVPQGTAHLTNVKRATHAHGPGRLRERADRTLVAHAVARPGRKLIDGRCRGIDISGGTVSQYPYVIRLAQAKALHLN